MKKHTKKPKKSEFIRKSANFNPFVAFLFAAAITAVGLWVLRNSFAQVVTSTGTITVSTQERKSASVSTALAGVAVTVKALNSSGGCPTTTTVKTTVLLSPRETGGPSDAQAAFSCKAPSTRSSIGYIHNIESATKAGYVLDSKLPIAFAVTSGSAQSATIYLQRDTDGDGVGDVTDKCTSTKGPASNNGCPVPPPPPAPTSPTKPSPAPAPKPSSSSSSRVAPPPAPAIIAATGSDKTPPSSPTGFTIDPSSDSIDLSWDASTDSSTAGYVLERSTDQTEWQTLSDSLTGTSYTDTDLSPEQDYYYRLRAKDAAGNQSEAVFADTRTLAAEKAQSSQSAVKKKSSAGHLMAVILSALLIILVVGGFIGWLIWRRKQLEVLNDVTNAEALTHAEEVIHHPEQLHSESLKDMVMDDFPANHTHNNETPEVKK
jgi:hypothetical protein